MNRLKALRATNKIVYITTPTGTKIHDSRLIADAFATYYSDLYNLHSDTSLAPNLVNLRVRTDFLMNAFKMILSSHLLNMFHHIIANKHLPKEMLQAMVFTLAKSGKPADRLLNYRPISLLNCDIKFIPKNRINKVLPFLIYPDQV